LPFASPDPTHGFAADSIAQITEVKLDVRLPTKLYSRLEHKTFALLNEARYRTTFQARYFLNRYIKGYQADKPPIFIVGPGHSGTSLLLAILGAHSNIFAIPFESDLAFKPEPVRKKLLRRFHTMTIVHRKSRWVEKTPRHIGKIDELLKLFPDARIVIIIRDGRDVACSYKARRGTVIDEHIDHWVAAAERARYYRHHPHVHVLRYEDLIADFGGTTRTLMAFLGETYEPRQAEYYREPIKFYWHKVEKPENSSGDNHKQYRNWQVNQPLFDGRGRWHEEMRPQEKEAFKRNAGELLVALGYESSNDW
jgi:hypothetical protein